MKTYETSFGNMSSRYEKKTDKTLILWTDVKDNFRCFEFKGKHSPSQAVDLMVNYILGGNLKEKQTIQTAILE
jgi:hypothetical protein